MIKFIGILFYSGLSTAKSPNDALTTLANSCGSINKDCPILPAETIIFSASSASFEK